MNKIYWVYTLSNAKNSTLYIGVTSDLSSRTSQHQTHLNDGFTTQYKLDRLVYAEQYDNPEEAITREKQLKNWRRKWKIELIEKDNPDWKDLSREIFV